MPQDIDGRPDLYGVPLLPEEREHFEWLIYGLLAGIRRLVVVDHPAHAVTKERCLDELEELFHDLLGRLPEPTRGGAP